MKIGVKSLVMVFMCAVIMVVAPLAAEATRVVELDEDTIFRAGDQEYTFDKEWAATLYDDGTIKSGHLKYPIQIHFDSYSGYFSAYFKGYIEFYPEGQVRCGGLAEDAYLPNDKGGMDKYRVGPDKIIFFNKDGKVTGYY